MPAYDFKQRFAPLVRSGEKRQTIRQRGKRLPPKLGDPLMLYTGLRTTQCAKLLDAVCISCEPITISPSHREVKMLRECANSQIWDALNLEEIDAIAKADGFANADDFFAFFADEYGGTLSGWLIKW